MLPKIKNRFRLIILSIFLLNGINVFAQDVPVTKTTESSYNQAQILMIIVALLLAFVIWGMGQAILALGKQALEKSKTQKNILPVLLMIGCSLLTFVGNAQDTAATQEVQVVANYGGMNGTAFWLLAITIAIEIILILFMLFFIKRLQVELMPQKVKPVKSFSLKKYWSFLDKKLFTKAVAVEREADILLEHDYDGIRELDNALPPWWKYGFIITIVVAFVYLINFHVQGYGKNPTQEYQAEMEKAQVDKIAYEEKSKDRIDEGNIKMPDDNGIAAGKEIFTTTCWPCHGKEGEGGAGPNLTDDYWLHKGSLNDIYASIKHGYPDKGMQAWEKNFSPKQISDLAGFIKTLHNTKPANGKAPQGDLFTEAGTDSTGNKPAASDSVPKIKTPSNTK